MLILDLEEDLRIFEFFVQSPPQQRRGILVPKVLLASRSPASAETNLSLSTKQVFFKQGAHGFQRLAQVVGAPGLPTVRFVLEYPVIEPLPFDLGLNGELLQLLERRRL